MTQAVSGHDFWGRVQAECTLATTKDKHQIPQGLFNSELHRVLAPGLVLT